MKILLTGATGLIGRSLGIRLIEKGHSLVVVVRDPARARLALPFPAAIYAWDTRSPVPLECMKGVDAIVHLAGEPVASKRWSALQKTKIMDSRVQGTRRLVEAVLASPVKPSVFISASAIGYYGDRGDEVLTESSSGGAGFLAEVCRKWEEEASRLQADVRLVISRIGLVLSERGGALEKMVPLFRSGLGGRLGSGNQWMSWIHLEDLISFFVFALEDSRVKGVVNAVGPDPVINREFTRLLGGALHKPAVTPAPSLALKTVLGELSEAVLGSQRVSPETLKTQGFHFKYKKLSEAFSNIFLCPDKIVFNEETFLAKPLREVFEFFSEARNLEAITPPWLQFRVTNQSTPKITEGTLIDYRLKIHGVPVNWQSKITDWDEGRSFADTQIKGPYRSWHHTHSFKEFGGGTLMTDRVLYSLPLGTLGQMAGGWKVASDVQDIFSYRKTAIEKLLGEGK